MGTPASDTSGVRIFPPLIFVAGLAVGFLLQWLAPVPLVSASRLAAAPAVLTLWRTLGALLVVLWLALATYAVVTFRRAGTPPNPARPTTALALGGPYRFTRNPMYLGFAFLQIGVSLWANALWPLAVLVPVLFVVRRAVIDREERYLERKFGEEYRLYKARVRRWL